MICPKCGEVNSSNFLFCGMCGTILEPARKATAPTVQAPRAAETPSVANAGIVTPSVAPTVPPVPSVAAVGEPVPPISGPSMLGLDDGNSVDVLRDRAFSGLASYGRTEEPKSAGKEVLLTVVLLAALAGAGWWTYKNYIGVAGTHKATATAPPVEGASTPPDNPASKIEKSDVKEAPAAAERPPEDVSTAPVAKLPVEKPASPETTATAETKEAEEPATEKPAKPVAPAPTPARHEVSATRLPATKPAPAATDTSDALFRRGQTYLYGRHGAEDCANAVKYLKMAADQQHAKARSMMGTMYATGHCVPRDLPSSYRWFALALRVDPNNSILEKNLSAVWNQMTPPERQLATRSQ